MTGSYQFEKLVSRELEHVCLADRAQLRLADFVPLLKRHQFPERGRVLEVGCGQGIRTSVLAENFQEAEIIGLDRSPELLMAAYQNGRQSRNLSFTPGDLFELPFPDESFDFVYARLVFMHLTDPVKALTSLKRVLRPGGRILIEDADRDCMFFEPQPKSFREFWLKVQEGQRRLGGDPNVGRKLAPLLKEVGLEDINIELQPLQGRGKDIDFLVRTLMPSLNLYLPPQDRQAGQAAIEDLARLADDPLATFYHFWFAVSGSKR